MLAELITALVAVAYRIGVGRAWSTAGAGRIVTRAQVGCFAAGAAAVAVAVGPMHPLADHSLAGHMVQHVVLITVAAPLLALGGTVPALLWALPGKARRRLLPVWRKALGSTAGSGWVWWAGSSIVVQSAVMWAWHAPVLFDAALSREWVHALEHASFLVSATVMWWVLLAGRRARRGTAALAVFIAAFPGTALGAAMLLSPNPWYPPYAHVSSVGAALTDQQLAGVVMWSFAGLVYVAASAGLFGTWLRATSDPEPSLRFLAPRPGGEAA